MPLCDRTGQLVENARPYIASSAGSRVHPRPSTARVVESRNSARRHRTAAVLNILATSPPRSPSPLHKPPPPPPQPFPLQHLLRQRRYTQLPGRLAAVDGWSAPEAPRRTATANRSR